MPTTSENNVPLPSSSSKRIVSNALVLFVRMFFLTLINLYSVRIILKGLGDTDYGLYSTVTGVITSSAFVSSVLALSVQRFLSYAIGTRDNQKLLDIFSASMNITLALTAIVLIVFEVGGTWFVANELTIPAERMTATLQAYQFTLFAFIFSLLQIPYTAAIFAHEDMGIYALVSTVECILKLAAAYLMMNTTPDHLAFYSFLLLIVSIITFATYLLIGRYRYCECRYHKVKTAGLHKELLSFSGWSFLGPLANMGMIQGNIILLNIFFGPLINTAFGIALQINNAFNTLCNCIVIAMRPAMIKSYADNSFKYLTRLFNISNKLLLYSLIAIGLPFLLEMDTVLEIWLGKVSETTLLFSRLIICYIVVLGMNAPITTIIQATGRVKEYHLRVESFTLLCVPITLIFFLLHLPAWTVFGSMVGICVIAHVIRLICLRQYYKGFSIREYLMSLCLPAFVICLLAVTASLLLHFCLEQNTTLRLLMVFTISPALVVMFVYLGGISHDERIIIRQFITTKLNLWHR